MGTSIAKAQEFQKSNLFDKAAAEYLQAARETADNTSQKMDLLLLAGDCMYYNDTAAEMDIYKEVLGVPVVSEEQKATARLKIARRYMRDGNYKAAVAEMEVLVLQSNISSIQKAEAYANMGESLWHLKLYDAAMKAIRKALAAKSGLDIDRRIKLASKVANICYYQNECSVEKAYETICNTLGSDVTDNEFLAKIGIITTLVNCKKFDQASNMCNEILKATRHDDILNIYASACQVQILTGLKSYGAAISLADQVISQYKESLSANSIFNVTWNKALALFSLARYDDAVIEYKRILDMKDVYYSPLAQLQIGNCYIALGKHEYALDAFEDLKKMPLLTSQQYMIKDADRQISEIKKNNASQSRP